MQLSTSPPNVAVFVKHVPIAAHHLDVRGGRACRDNVPHGLDPLNEVTLEWALCERERGCIGRVVAITMGPPTAEGTLRRALAFGADEGWLVSDEALAGADVRQTARVLAAAARRVGAGIAAFGYESLDGSSGVVPSAVAALLDWPLVSRVSSTTRTGDGALTAERDLGAGRESVATNLPAVLTFVEGGLTVRYPRLKDVIAARKRPIQEISMAELEVPGSSRQAHIERVDAVPATAKQARVVTAEEGPSAILEMLGSDGSC